MAKSRRRLRNESARLRAEVARLQAIIEKTQKRPRYVQDTPYYSGVGGANSYQAILDFLPRSKIVVAENGTVYGDAPSLAKIKQIEAELNEKNDGELLRILRGTARATLTAETTLSQKGESDVHK